MSTHYAYYSWMEVPSAEGRIIKMKTSLAPNGLYVSVNDRDTGELIDQGLSTPLLFSKAQKDHIKQLRKAKVVFRCGPRERATLDDKGYWRKIG